MNDGRRIFDGAHLRAELFDEDSDRLMVTFDFRKSRRKGFTRPARPKAFLREGVAHLAIGTAANDWFVNPETEALTAALAVLAGRYRRVGGIGFSMGGYGGLRFAGALGMTSLVAVSPQVSIDPAVVPFDRRYRRDAAGFDPVLGDLSRHPAPGLRGLILVDPFRRRDMRNAQMIRALFPGLALARAAFGGHPATGVMRAGGRAHVLHREARSAAPSVRAVTGAHRAARRDAPVYWEALAQRLEARRPALAHRAREAAAALRTSPPEEAG